MKRLFDITFSIFILIVTLPLIILAAFAIKIDSKGAIFFNSTRVGQKDKDFIMFKLRTMYDGTELVESSKIKDTNKKITTVGRILRKYSIDELPQFISVIIGDMSIVGPRPALRAQKKIIMERTKLGINLIKPGITGLAQINGRDALSVSDKLTLDVEYLNRQSFWFDIKILWMTFFKVVKRNGVIH